MLTSAQSTMNIFKEGAEGPTNVLQKNVKDFLDSKTPTREERRALVKALQAEMVLEDGHTNFNGIDHVFDMITYCGERISGCYYFLPHTEREILGLDSLSLRQRRFVELLEDVFLVSYGTVNPKGSENKATFLKPSQKQHINNIFKEFGKGMPFEQQEGIDIRFAL